jgi:hypothetical protein
MVHGLYKAISMPTVFFDGCAVIKGSSTVFSTLRCRLRGGQLSSQVMKDTVQGEHHEN